MSKNVLICSAGRRVSLVRSFQEQGRRLVGADFRVFATDLAPNYSGACRVSDGAFEIGRFADPSYISDLLQICEENEVGMVVPTIDTELLLLAGSKSQFAARGISLVVSDLEFVEICRDKNATIRFFKEHKISVPDAVDIDKPSFPFFVKPVSGSSSKDVFVIRDDSQLAPYLCDRSKFIHQEYLDPRFYEEYTVDMYYSRDSELRCAVPRRRLEVRGGEISKGFTVRNAVYKQVMQVFQKLPGAVGCITLQVFMEKSSCRIYGIEINPRFGGGYPLSYLAGADFPGMLIREYMLGEPIKCFEQWEEGLLFLRYDSEVVVHASERQ